MAKMPLKPAAQQAHLRDILKNCAQESRRTERAVLHHSSAKLGQQIRVSCGKGVHHTEHKEDGQDNEKPMALTLPQFLLKKT